MCLDVQNQERIELVKFNSYLRMTGVLACSPVLRLHKGWNWEFERAMTHENCWNSGLLELAGLLLQPHRCVSVHQAGEGAEWVHDGVYRPWFHCVSCWLKHQVIWDWRLCLLRSRRAVSHATDYLCQRGESQVPPWWVGSELVLSEVNNRVFRPLCFSVPYSQTFSVKTVWIANH